MEKRRVVAIYNSHEALGEALALLINQLKLKRRDIAVLGKGENGEPKDIFEVKKENSDILFWGEQGAIWGAIFGFLAGGFFAFVPGFGPLVAAGPIVSSLAGAVGGAEVLGSAAALAAWFIDLGVEEVEAHKYAEYLKEGKIVLLADAASDEKLEEIKKALKETGAEEIKVYTE